jgi:hypothetical protein
LPDDTRRLIEIEDAIAKIRTQIATADLTRQRTVRSRSIPTGSTARARRCATSTASAPRSSPVRAAAAGANG